MLSRLRMRAQTTAEYAILIALVIAAVTAMQIYVKRGVQGQVKGAVDGLVNTGIATQQYEPYYLQSTADTNQNLSENESIAVGGAVNKSSTGTTQATRNQTITPSQ